jgi:hypothetical protein
MALLLALALGGCGGPPVKTAAEMNASYEQALERTAAAAVAEPAGDPGASLALGRAQAFFSAMSVASVRTGVAATYAGDAYLNDTLAVVEGAGAIGAYFERSLGRVRALDVEFLGSSRDGVEHYVRWRMTVVSDQLGGGEPMVSYGMSHFRFDADGRILLHKDFWDAGTGLYEYLPVIGSVLRGVRGAAEGDRP